MILCIGTENSWYNVEVLSLNRMVSLVYFVSPFIVKWSEEMGYGEHYTWCTCSFSRLSPHEARLDFKLGGILIWYQEDCPHILFFPPLPNQSFRDIHRSSDPILEYDSFSMIQLFNRLSFLCFTCTTTYTKSFWDDSVHLLPEVPVFIVKSSCKDYVMEFLVQCILYKIPTT